jgi:TRAP-type C4-dicarboxylate transport system permease small subunit
MDKLLKWLEVPIDALLWLAIAAGFLMMMHVSIDVTGRTVFHRPLAGTTEVVAAYYMVAAAYLPWAWVARHGGHIRADLFARIGSARYQFWLDVAARLLTAVYLAVFTWQTGVRALQQFRLGEAWQASGGYLAVWPSRWMLPVAGGLMLAYLVLRLAADLAHRRRS